MLDFMIIGLPRSGTTWAANWLTTDTVHCLHDPLYTLHYRDLDASPRFPHGAVKGVSCTGLLRMPDWVNAHPARKLILRRPLDEVNASLRRLGLRGDFTSADEKALSEIHGRHVPWESIFDARTAPAIWERLTALPFNAARHRELVEISVQPQFSKLTVDRGAVSRLLAEMRAGGQGR